MIEAAQKLKLLIGRALAAITMPVWLPLVSLLFGTEVVFLPRELAFQRKMRSAGRVLSWKQLYERVQGREGTVIVEWPTLGWSYSRAWWIEDVIDPQLLTQNESSNNWDTIDQWHARYTHPVSGKACLVKIWSGEEFVQRLLKRFPDVLIVRYCSISRRLFGRRRE